MANLGIIDADPSEPPSDEDVIFLANRLLGEFNIPTKIEKIEHISAALFVVLYESLFSERLPGIIRQPFSREDEIHNCQTVIDVLSTEIVHDSLSHIRGIDVVAENITAISNLLDIFSYLLEYVVNKIESDVPTDNEDKDYELGGMPTEVSERKNGLHTKNKVNGSQSRSKNNEQNVREAAISSNAAQNRNENRSAVITHEEYCQMISGTMRMADIANVPPSPIRPDQSESFLGQKTVDSTDFDGEEVKGKSIKSSAGLMSPPKIAWTEKTDEKHTLAEFEKNIQQADTAMSVPEPSPTQATNGLAASVPLSKSTDNNGRSEPMRATVGPIEYRNKATEEKSRIDKAPSEKIQEPATIKGHSSSYNDLKELVEKTATMTRVALDSSPIRRRAERDLKMTDFEEEPKPTISSVGARRAKELNAQSMKATKINSESPAVKVNKKVAFTSFGRDKSVERFDDKDYHHPMSEDHLRDGGLSQLTSFGYPFTSGNRTSRFKSSGGETKRPLHTSQTSKSRDSNRRKKPLDCSNVLAFHLARNRQPELGAAHMKLHTEDRAIKKKQDLLKQRYGFNLEEFTDDVDVMIEKDNQAAEEIETEMLKSYKSSAAKTEGLKKVKSASSVVSCKKPKMSKSAFSKTSPPAAHRLPSSSPTLDLKSDEDLLSMLLEEFPHLHLTDHTWHELWRKGLHQIESLTRVYQDNKRKKSRAQTQMEAAAERHNLLSNIMNKQLEQSKRLRDVKERKTQQVQVRNKAHDKRIQSARARRYYNEYQVRARGKQLKRRTKEEMVFRELFKDALSIQKERITDIRQYTSDQRKRQESRRQNEIDSLENFYQDQFAMLAEKLTKERNENSIRNAAQLQMLDRMKRELRKKMETEIALYQEQIFRDDDDVYFRQIDADKLKHQLHKATYSSL